MMMVMRDGVPVTRLHIVYGHPEPGGYVSWCANVAVARSCLSTNLDDESVTRLHVVYRHQEPGGHVYAVRRTATVADMLTASCSRPAEGTQE